MSLRHALLGLLADTPQTGYDLAKRFEQSLSAHAWHASHSHIYPELKRMTADGLVEVVEEGARGSRTYGITGPGRAELRQWMFSPMGETPARNEFVLRLFMLSSLDIEDTRELVSRMAEASGGVAAELTESIEHIDQQAEPGVRPGFARFAAEFGLRWYELQRDWARWVLAELEKYPAGSAPSTNG
ncbi:PadR family transcriptional regulator [Kutzneria albida]|uniref:Transcription regulator PadR N-terminal domain-containing protein n=1 Tax=Kutzneria albida DSM 43870 TaxID=1449976 RepID=W5WSD9_9PSEU|nr:PadR family transcriptional regulator [Kutzneria albida]AHI01080.1 hypothetical protein KALB_7722 [Kutzneria albida DSM 43870]